MPDLTTLKDLADILLSLVTILAILVSGVWGYWLFIQNRQRFPRAKILHEVTCYDLPEHKRLVHVVVTIHNLGNILLQLVSVESRLQQVKPFPPRFLEAVTGGKDPVGEGQSEIGYWPMLVCHKLSFPKGTWEIEPCECQEIHHDFVIDHEVQVISLYTFIYNLTKQRRQIGWDLTTFHCLESGNNNIRKGPHNV